MTKNDEKPTTVSNDKTPDPVIRFSEEMAKRSEKMDRQYEEMMALLEVVKEFHGAQSNTSSKSFEALGDNDRMEVEKTDTDANEHRNTMRWRRRNSRRRNKTRLQVIRHTKAWPQQQQKMDINKQRRM